MEYSIARGMIILLITSLFQCQFHALRLIFTIFSLPESAFALAPITRAYTVDETV